MLNRGNNSEIGLYIKKNIFSELSSNIIDLCPVGALTHKNYSLNYRNWDSFYVENIDVFDFFLNDVRMYSDNNLGISRILPTSSFFFKNETNFISDQSRYFFDGLNLQRLNLPLVCTLKSFSHNSVYIKNFERFNVNDFFLITSWKKVSSLIWSYTDDFKKTIGICAILGDLVDLEAIYYFKTLTFTSGSNLLINKTNFMLNLDINQFNFDNQFNYLYKTNNNLLFENYDFYIFLNYNLRFENAVLNSKLRRRYIWNNFTNIYIFGSLYNLTYKYNHVGNKLLDLFDFLIGKHYLSNLILKYKNVMFVYGSQFMDRIDVKRNFLILQNNFVKLKNFLKKKSINCYINYLGTGSTIINSLDVNFYNISSFEKKQKISPLIYYYIGVNNLVSNNNIICNLNKKMLEKVNTLNIYQNTHIDMNYLFVHLILPTLNVFQGKNLYFVNCYGLIKISKKMEFNLNKNLKENSEIFYFLFYHYLKIINKPRPKTEDEENIDYNCEYMLSWEYEKLYRKKNLIIKYLPVSLYKKEGRGIELEKLFILYKFLNISFFFSSVLFVNRTKNFYKSNIYSFYSKQLTSISYLFFNEKSNFDV